MHYYNTTAKYSEVKSRTSSQPECRTGCPIYWFAARLIAEEEHKQLECNLKINFELEKMEAKHALDMANVQATLDVLRVQHSSFVEIKDSEIKRLQELALKNPNDNANWWFGGGVVVGIITSIVIFYAAVEIQK